MSEFRDIISVPSVISLDCLEKMWALSQDDVEWGGRLLPIHPEEQSSCKIDVGRDLVKGSQLKSRKNKQGTLIVRSASVPLHSEVLSSSPSCHEGVLTNMFFHTHPATTREFSPPSASDFAAHTVIGNIANWQKHQQINTALLMHRRGLYVYGITLPALKKWIKRGRLIAHNMKEDADEEFSDSVLFEIKSHVEKQLATGYQLLDEALAEQAKSPRAKRITPQQNPLLSVLHEHGFYYDFYESPFRSDIVIESAGRIIEH